MQGDPLYPYLFILVIKVLSIMITIAKLEGLIQGIKIARSYLSITYLLFVDNSLFFFIKANQVLVKNLMLILEKCNKVFGWKINLQKSTLFSMLILINKQSITFQLCSNF